MVQDGNWEGEVVEVMVLVAVVFQPAASSIMVAVLKSYTTEVLVEVEQMARGEYSHNCKGSSFPLMVVNTAGMLD